MLSQCFILLLIGGFVAPFSISSKVQDLQNVGGGRMISWEPRTMISSEDYPCTAEGLYEHPSNCSRFYRCVDFTRESRIFSRYLFECPGGMVFAKTINACVPGVCPEKAMTLPDPAEGQDMEADSGNASVPVDVGGIAGSMPDMPDMPDMPEMPDAGSSDDAGDMVTTMAPAAESSGDSQPSGLPPVIDQDTSVVSPEQVPESMENCPGKYIQHAKYCNLFHLCDDPDNLFSCYEGTAFSTQRQMCRLYQFEESLCKGKEVFVPSAELFREAFQWNEVGVVPLDKNPVYNANPYVFTNIGELPEGFTHTKATFKAPTSSRVAPLSPLAPVPVQDTKDRKKTRFSSLLGTFSSLISDSSRRRPPIRKSSTRKSPVQVVPSIPKISQKDKPISSQTDSNFDFSDFDFSALLPYASLLSSSLSGLASAIEPSQPDSIAVSPHGSAAGFINPLVSSSAAYSPLKGFGESQSQYPGQGYQMGYIVAPSSFAYSPYSGLYPYAFGSAADPSSFLRGQFASSPTSTQFQGVPFTSSPTSTQFQGIPFTSSPTSTQFQGVPFTSAGSYFPYSSYLGAPSPSFGFPASSQYGYVYDPTRNSISPISIPSSYLSSLYGSLLGLNPYNSLFQMDDQTSEDIKISPVLPDTETFKPEKGTDRLKLKEFKEPEKSAFQRELTKRYPFLFNTRGTSKYSFPSSPLVSSSLYSSPLASSSLSSLPLGSSPLAHAFEARNKDGDTFQVIPLSNDEVATLASQGLLDRAVTVGKDFSYDDLKELNKGEVILATFPKK